MTKTKAGPIAGDRIKSFLERIEKLIEERAAIGSDIRDIFAEAKGVGYDVKTMRKLIQLRAMDANDRAEAEALLDTYAHAIGLDVASLPREPSEDELLEQVSRIVEEVDRCMDLIRDGNKPPKIEAIKQLIGCSTGKAAKLRALVEKRMAEFSRAQPGERENENLKTADRKPPGDSSERDGEGSSSGAAVASLEPGRALDAAESERPAPAPIAEPIDWDAINATRPRELDRRKVAA